MNKYIFEEVEPGVYGGMSCFGMGVAMTYKNGIKMAELVNTRKPNLWFIILYY